MSESSPEGKPQIPPMPDIKDTKNIKVWMETHIIRPPKGYEDMKHPDGTPCSKNDQINTYIQQTLAVIELKKQRNHPEQSYESVRQSILNSTQPQDSTLEHK